MVRENDIDHKWEIWWKFFSGQFCHELLKKTAKWTIKTSLVDVVKAVIEHIDNPDIDYSLSLRLFRFWFVYYVFSSFFLELGREYMENRSEFNRKALDFVKKYALPRVWIFYEHFSPKHPEFGCLSLQIKYHFILFASNFLISISDFTFHTGPSLYFENYVCVIHHSNKTSFFLMTHVTPTFNTLSMCHIAIHSFVCRSFIQWLNQQNVFIPN
jgi:hypothetical protein